MLQPETAMLQLELLHCWDSAPVFKGEPCALQGGQLLMLVHSCLAQERTGTGCALQVGQLLMYVRISRSNRLLPFLTQIMALTQDCQRESCSPGV